MKRKILIKIEGMQCTNCPMILEGIEDKLPGVLSAEASYRKSQMLVEYDDARLSQQAIQAAIEKLGYGVSAIVPA